MKKIFLCFFVFVLTRGHSQNEFAATAFYNDFKKIHADALEGFSKFKGSKKPGKFNGFAEEYRIKLLLPLADSGKIVFPSIGIPYAEFFFQTANSKKEIDQRAVNLREALLTAYEKPLYARTETSTVKENIFSNTGFFANPDDSLAIFKTSIYQIDKKFFLSVRLMGKKE
ncbi:MAG: hypothetical protein ABUT20_59935 [Bacteroidota bacterium]